VSPTRLTWGAKVARATFCSRASPHGPRHSRGVATAVSAGFSGGHGQVMQRYEDAEQNYGTLGGRRLGTTMLARWARQLPGDEQQGHSLRRAGVFEGIRLRHDHAGDLGDGVGSALPQERRLELGGVGGKAGHGRPLVTIEQTSPDGLRLDPKSPGGERAPPSSAAVARSPRPNPRRSSGASARVATWCHPGADGRVAVVHEGHGMVTTPRATASERQRRPPDVRDPPDPGRTSRPCSTPPPSGASASA
jgi:hypothetical protein